MRGNVHIGSVKKRTLGTYMKERERETLFLCVTHLYRSLPLVVKGSVYKSMYSVHTFSVYIQV